MSDRSHPRCSRTLFLLAVLLVGGFVACDQPPEALLAPQDAALARASSAPQSFIVVAGSQDLSDELVAEVAGLGVTIDDSWPQIGVLRVTAANPAQFRARIADIDGIRGVAPDLELQWIDDPVTAEAMSYSMPAADGVYPPDTGDDDAFLDFLWGMTSVRAVDAWDAGLRGAGVRVAILDSGIDKDHADLAPNLNQALSYSFVPGLDWDIEPWMPSKHGSHVAGTVAAADNGIGVIGVAPEAELVAVRVLNEFGSGAWSWIINGILYAAAIDADLANMSLGGTILRSGYRFEPGRPAITANEVQELLVAMTRVVSWARQQGTLVIVSAGNNERDLDHDRDVLTVPAQIPGVVSVAATSPIGWANPAVFDGDLDHPTYYTNHGNTGVTFAAPGGSVEYYFLYDAPAPPSDCTMTLASIGPQTLPCYVFDMVMSSTYNDGMGSNWYSWYQGTSMAAPHVTGIAALVIGANGGDMQPAQVEAALRSVAEDLGVPGRDPYHGLGQVRTGY